MFCGIFHGFIDIKASGDDGRGDGEEGLCTWVARSTNWATGAHYQVARVTFIEQRKQDGWPWKKKDSTQTVIYQLSVSKLIV